MTRYTHERLVTLNHKKLAEPARDATHEIQTKSLNLYDLLGAGHLLDTRAENQDIGGELQASRARCSCVFNTSRVDTTITSEAQDQAASDHLTNTFHRSPLGTQHSAATGINEQLKMLEERMTRLERRFTEVARFENVPKNTPKMSEAVDGKTSSMIPQLFLARFGVDQDQQRVAGFSTSDEVQFFTASEESDVAARNVLEDEQKRSGRSVCWLFLLESLHRNEAELKRYGCYTQQQNTQCLLVSPALRLREMSFNVIQPDIAQVSAVTTVHEISIIARRLGMSWEDFNPELGSMRAKGNGHGLFSTLARSTGIVLQYIHLEGGASSNVQLILPDTKASSKAELFIPSREADLMGFGILPGCESLGVPNFNVGTNDEVYATMDLLDSTRDASTKLRNLNRLLVGKWDAHCMYGFSDIIALAAPMIRRRHSTIVRLPPPAEYCSSLLSRKECFVVFCHRLEEHLRTQPDDIFSEQATWILKQCEQLTSRYSEWETNVDSLDKVND